MSDACGGSNFTIFTHKPHRICAQIRMFSSRHSRKFTTISACINQDSHEYNFFQFLPLLNYFFCHTMHFPGCNSTRGLSVTGRAAKRDALSEQAATSWTFRRGPAAHVPSCHCQPGDRRCHGRPASDLLSGASVGCLRNTQGERWSVTVGW
jgi:hypothetical protein